MSVAATERQMPHDVVATCRANSEPTLLYKLWGVWKLSFLSPSGEDGPEFCRDDIVDCNDTCSEDKLCTSSCNCWTGEGVSPTDVAPFTGVRVEDQG